MATYVNSSGVGELPIRDEWGPADGDPSHFNLTAGKEIFGNFSGETAPEQAIPGRTRDGAFESRIIIPLYAVIFVLSVVGNSLVLATLGRKNRMRTVTNVYLLNLAVSDLLLGVFCMPFTLVGQVLRNFIFGAAMCKMIPYFQAVSVSVAVWTLVVISLERYFAICRPLKSRRWQTQFHAYKMITFVWLSSLAWTSPILLFSRLKALKMGRHKCREEWPNPTSEKVFNMFLDVVLLLVPLVIMTLAYSLIVSKLWKGLRHEIKHSTNCRGRQDRCSSTATVNGIVLNGSERDERDASLECGTSRGLLIRVQGCTRQTGRKPSGMRLLLKKVNAKHGRKRKGKLTSSVLSLPVKNLSPKSANVENSQMREASFSESTAHKETKSYTFTRHAIRSNYMDKSIEAKKKVIRMLFVVVAEFFICWAPLHILNTWYLFSPEDVYQHVGATGVSLVQLLAYISSCCNPITYCFMNRKFRQSFLNVFSCWKYCNTSEDGKNDINRSCKNPAAPNRSEMSGNDSTAYAGKVAC